MIFQQLSETESSTYTYLLGDENSREAVIIDPVLDTFERDLALLKSLDLKLLYILDTHVHADHITGAGALRAATGAKTGISALAQVGCADLALKDGDTLTFGSLTLEVIETPGHTDSCLSFKVGDNLFTGDALLIGGTGRTDFQGGSAKTLFKSLQSLFQLPLNTRVYPGHDYNGKSFTTLAAEKATNPRIGFNHTEEEFVRIMAELKLAPPRKIQEALPANRACGEKT